jgi:hypothetical protein
VRNSDWCVLGIRCRVSGMRSGVGRTFGWRVDPFGECRFLLVDVSLGDNVHSRLVPLD